jgi:anti-anti-sigma factor
MAADSWKIDVFDDGVTLFVTPVGELDIYTVPRLEEAFGRLRDDHRALILEVSELTFVDSTGLKAMANMRRAEPERFMLSGSCQPLERVLELSGMTNVFKRLSD